MRDGRHWGAFPAVLRRRLPDANVVTLDFPGNGPLYRERTPASVEALAEYCRAELGRRELTPPWNLLAMSLGAMVAVAWAVRHPGEISAGVLINTSLRPFSPFYQRLRPAAWPSVLRFALAPPDARGCEEIILRLTTSRAQQHGPLVLDDWARWRTQTPVSRANALRQLHAAARFRAPPQAPGTRLLILTGAADALVNTRCSQTLAAAWGCDIASHPAAGHDLPLDDAEWVAERVATWMSSPGMQYRAPAGSADSGE